MLEFTEFAGKVLAVISPTAPPVHELLVAPGLVDRSPAVGCSTVATFAVRVVGSFIINCDLFSSAYWAAGVYHEATPLNPGLAVWVTAMVEISGVVAADPGVDLPIFVQGTDGEATAASAPGRSFSR
jgi:hypothetical protein